MKGFIRKEMVKLHFESG